MAGSLERSTLHVEGIDDFHTIFHLLRRHGIECDSKIGSPPCPMVVAAGDVDKLLATIKTGVELSGGRSIGFVLDADSPLANRWNAVRDRLVPLGVQVPLDPVATGFVGSSTKYKSTVGVWLMPDNQQDGNLEHFLEGLIDEHDAMIGHATSATTAAKQLGAEFGDSDRQKAVLAAWLAWQKTPGLPYGTAIRARFFRDDSPAASAFVAWFRALYGIV